MPSLKVPFLTVLTTQEANIYQFHGDIELHYSNTNTCCKSTLYDKIQAADPSPP
jgi:hypothetical protein